MEIWPEEYQAIVKSNSERTGFPMPVCAVIFNTNFDIVRDNSQHKNHGKITNK